MDQNFYRIKEIGIALVTERIGNSRIEVIMNDYIE